MLTDVLPHNVESSKIACLTRMLERAPLTSDSLYSGNLGKALYYFYLYQYGNDQGAKQQGEEILDAIFEKLSANQSRLMRHISLSKGLTGLAWSLHILYSEHLIEYDIPPFIQPIDRSISRVIAHYIAQDDLDFMHSSVGALAYLTDRLSTAPELRSTLETCVLALEKKLSPHQYGQYIQNLYIHKKYQYGEATDVNLGLSHGLCSILLVLLQLYEKGIHQEKIARIVEQNILFLLSTLRVDNFADSRRSAFPSNIIVDIPSEDERNQHFYAQRMGWCYGDLNQVLLLYRAGMVLGNNEWIEIADRVGSFTLQKRSYEETKIEDAFLCHGTSGVAQFYKSLYQLSGHQQYRVGYDYWLQQTVERLNSTFDDTEADIAPGFLEGLIGTGLVLMNQEVSLSSQWEKLMLLNNQSPL